ncbi:DNA polymerase-3 subunit epsilon, partial [Paracoccus alcaliphilus]
MLTRLALRLRILLIFAGLAAAVLGFLVLALWVAGRRLTGQGADTGAMSGAVPDALVLDALVLAALIA